MPLSKYARVEDVPPADVGSGDPARDLAAACELSVLANRLSGWHPPRGLHRDRSLEEAQARRATWETPPPTTTRSAAVPAGGPEEPSAGRGCRSGR